ncbi:conserved Plasmodium protein, unknown function [Plasmodium sp. gorilla clade G1]|nr:conserved Plasmodium protein, unknown function [Plasmodium sp. gorilla clade G1]
MNYLSSFFCLILFLLYLNFCACMWPWTKKWKAENQMAIIKDMSKEIRHKAETLPTPRDITNKIHRIDKDVIDQLNKDIIDEENLSKHKAHICLEPNYERDYKYLCPEGWIKNKNGQCWGLHYDGHCESLKYFQEYNDNEKKEFELSCCVLWPKLKSDNKKKSKKRKTIRGSIKSSNGLIIRPKNI